MVITIIIVVLLPLLQLTGMRKESLVRELGNSQKDTARPRAREHVMEQAIEKLKPSVSWRTSSGEERTVDADQNSACC
jgi:hypothetical protein